MNLAKDAAEVFQKAVHFAAENKYEYVTPEMILLMMLKDESFKGAFLECGGDIKLLEKQLNKYISEYVEKVKDSETQLSYGVTHLLNFAGQSAYSSGCREIHVRHMVHALWNLE